MVYSSQKMLLIHDKKTVKNFLNPKLIMVTKCNATTDANIVDS